MKYKSFEVNAQNGKSWKFKNYSDACQYASNLWHYQKEKCKIFGYFLQQNGCYARECLYQFGIKSKKEGGDINEIPND